MTPHQTLAVTVRLSVLWLFFYAIPNLIGYYVSMKNYSGSETLHEPLLWAVGIILLICTLLWNFPLFIAKKILPISASFNSQTPEFENWFSVGCTLIGVWLLATAFPSVLSYASVIYLDQNSVSQLFKTNPNWLLNILFTTFKLIIGIWLFMGSKGLKKVVHWARYA